MDIGKDVMSHKIAKKIRQEYRKNRGEIEKAVVDTFYATIKKKSFFQRVWLCIKILFGIYK